MSAERNIHNRDLLFSVLVLDLMASGFGAEWAVLDVSRAVQYLPESHWVKQTAPDCTNWLEVITVAWGEQVRCVESLSPESRDQIRATLSSQTAPNVDWYPTPDFDEDLALLMAGKLDA